MEHRTFKCNVLDGFGYILVTDTRRVLLATEPSHLLREPSVPCEQLPLSSTMSRIIFFAARYLGRKIRLRMRFFPGNIFGSIPRSCPGGVSTWRMKPGTYHIIQRPHFRKFSRLCQRIGPLVFWDITQKRWTCLDCAVPGCFILTRLKTSLSIPS